MSRIPTSSLQDRVTSVDWSFADADTKYLTHNIHRYSGKFIPAVAREAIEMLTVPGETVFDPFGGSGTTVLEALLLGRHGIATDLNPLACLIAKVKTTSIPRSILRAAVSRMRSELSCYRAGIGEFQLSNASQQDAAKYRQPWFEKWFHSERLDELIFIKSAIDDEGDERCRDLLLVAFSDVLRASSNAHSGYPNVMFDRRRKKPPAVLPRFITRMTEIASSVYTLDAALPEGSSGVIVLGDAGSNMIPPESADAIVTHPPYMGSIPYAEYGVLSLKWLGHDPKRLDEELLGGKRQRRDTKERFRTGYARFFLSSFTTLKAGRHLFILVGNPLVRGERIDLALMSKEYAKYAGFVLCAETVRKGMNRRANLMGDETVLIFEKPHLRPGSDKGVAVAGECPRKGAIAT